jgi:hypothetical protein
MAKWNFLFALVIAGCGSKPTRGPAAEKVTQTPPTPGVEVFIKTDFAPRRVDEVELGALNAFKSCLLTHAAPISVGFSGKITFHGRIEQGQVEGVEGALKQCLDAAIPSILLGRGRIGLFKLAIATGPNLLKGAKSRIISHPEVKKFE